MTARDALWVVLQRSPEAMRMYDEIQSEIVKAANNDKRELYFEFSDNQREAAELIFDMLARDGFECTLGPNNLTVEF